jgi:hypothetical protein
MIYPDKLGCYRVGDLKFYSKLEAIEAMSRTGIHLHWDFNEAVFSSYDWTIEPIENILELYRQRAQQLREQYDYIALFWSGGADSETVRQSFNNNGIKLDEIVSYCNYQASNSKTDLMNSELFFRTIPQAEQLKYDFPEMKFRILDQSELYLRNFDNNDTKFHWMYNMNMMFTPNHVVRDGIGLKVKEWADIIHKGKKFCLLWGIDKPRVFQANNRFCFKFIDMVDLGPKVTSMAGQQPYTDELFFWSPDFPKIAIKQGHLIKNYLTYNWATSPFVSNKKSHLAFLTVNGSKYWLNNHGVHSVIYPNWNIMTFDAGKPSSNTIFSPRDQWFFDLESDNYAKKSWYLGIDYLSTKIPDYWKNDPQNITAGIKACWSKEYFLE